MDGHVAGGGSAEPGDEVAERRPTRSLPGRVPPAKLGSSRPGVQAMGPLAVGPTLDELRAVARRAAEQGGSGEFARMVTPERVLELLERVAGTPRLRRCTRCGSERRSNLP